MAGHSKFKNIMHRKGAQDKKRANAFTKIVREVIVAVKSGGDDPNTNLRLRMAIAAAKAMNMPKDKVDNAIKKATSNDIDSNYDEVRYEGYGPAGTAIIVEGLTSNRNRTASEIRTIFGKNGGHLGETGSVSYMFNRSGLIIYSREINVSSDELLGTILEIGADDCIEHDEAYEIICKQEDFHTTKEQLTAKYGEPLEAKITWRSNNIITLSGDDAVKAEKLIDALEDSDDVQNVSHNFEITG